MSPSKDRFLQDRPLYEEALRRYVCSRCIDLGEDGICHSQDPEGCGVFRWLPELVRIAENLHERKIEPYLKAVREQICTKCRSESPEGGCQLREKLDCGLDRYLPLVLEAIEEVDGYREWHLWRQL